MNIPKKNRISPRLYAIAVASIIIVALMAYVAFATYNNNSLPGDASEKNQTSESKHSSNNEADSDSPIDESPAPSKDGYTDKPPTPQPSDTSKSKVDVNLTAKSQDEGPGLYRFRFNISSVANTGTCTLTLHGSNSTVVTKTASVFQAGASISTCKGFDVPLSELSNGEWQYTMIFENDTLYGTTSGVAEVR